MMQHPPAAPSPDAERERRNQSQREYRERDNAGTRCALAYVPLDLVEKLVEGGLFSEGKPATNAAEKAAERKRLGIALVEAAWRGVKKCYGITHRG